MLMKQAMNRMPRMDMIGMISGVMGTSRTMGWLVHFMTGTLVLWHRFWVHRAHHHESYRPIFIRNILRQVRSSSNWLRPHAPLA
jgi:hypothetical protein